MADNPFFWLKDKLDAARRGGSGSDASAGGRSYEFNLEAGKHDRTMQRDQFKFLGEQLAANRAHEIATQAAEHGHATNLERVKGEEQRAGMNAAFAGANAVDNAKVAKFQYGDMSMQTRPVPAAKKAAAAPRKRSAPAAPSGAPKPVKKAPAKPAAPAKPSAGPKPTKSAAPKPAAPKPPRKGK